MEVNRKTKYITGFAAILMLIGSKSQINAYQLNREGGVYSKDLLQQENVELNLVNQKKFDRKFFKNEEKSLLQMDSAQDDLDDVDIAAFSQDLSDTADNYQTLSQQEESKKQKAAELKKELAKKKAQLKAL